MAEIRFDVDKNGMVITRPLLGWTMAPIEGMFLLARLNYAETPADIGNDGKAIQLILTPQQALELADVLTKQAKHILGAPPQGSRH